MKKYQNIPTNIITGFLGVGKTTLIKALLRNKPKAERWAVLVNEFGEVGIDGALMNADGIAVKEVAGGCMCCAVGLPSRVALNRLIQEQNPHRIIIEPTGLAHPKQVLDMFGGAQYQGVLDIRAVICLIDPWSVTQEKFLQLPAFWDQVTMADVLVATKSDVSSPEQLLAFQDFAGQLPEKKQEILSIAAGELPARCLDLAHKNYQAAPVKSHQDQQAHALSQREKTPDEQGVIRSESEADFAYACGWIFPENQIFEFEKLFDCINQLNVPRVKGVFHTDRGWFVINRMRDVSSSDTIQAAQDSRVEMIDTQKTDWLSVDRLLRVCRR